ncbi:MAG: type VI secretion system tip protein TssI/VgrG [Myxococcota bacterium]
MKPTYPYTAKTGDWLAKIAEDHGTTVSEIWSHPDNREHKAKRGSPDVLYPGDVIHIPYTPEVPPPPVDPPELPSLPPLPSSVPPPPIPVPPVVPPVLPSVLPFDLTGSMLGMLEPFPLVAPIRRLSGAERMSGTFRHRALIDDTLLAVSPTQLLGHPVVVVLEALRVVTGVVAAVRAVPNGCVIEVVPRLRLLQEHLRSQVYTERTSFEIAADLALGAGVNLDASLLDDLPRHLYRTQYEETDYSFFRRVLSDDGLFFFPAAFPDVSDVAAALGTGETWRVADYPEAYVRSPLHTFPYAPQAFGTGGYVIKEFRSSTRLATLIASFGDTDPDLPNLPVSAEASVPETDASPQTAAYRHRVYGREPLFPDHDDLPRRARAMLDARRRRAVVAVAITNCPSLAPGCVFRMQGHPGLDQDGDYVVTRVRHQLGSEEGYRNRVECVPAHVAYRPPRRRPRRATSSTATVVSDDGQEIDTDAIGRVRVRFPWEASGRITCYLRTLQAMAGPGWGTQFLPRVGTEVVVIFEGGNPDRPLVIGSLYNGAHLPPFGLPAEQATSGFRSSSTPGGESQSELSFDDTTGQEQVALRSACHLTLEAQKSLTQTVHGSVSVATSGGYEERIGGAATVHITGEHHLVVHATQRLQVEDRAVHQYAADREVVVDGKSRHIVHGPTFHECDDDVDVQVRGNRVQRVLGHDVKVVGGDCQEVCVRRDLSRARRRDRCHDERRRNPKMAPALAPS